MKVLTARGMRLLEAAAVDDFEMPAEAEEPAEAQTEEENHEAAE